MFVDYEKSLAARPENKITFGDGFYIDVAQTNQIKAGELHVPPKGKAGYDAGHIDADEVFYVAKGDVCVYFPQSGKRETVKCGNYIFMPRGLPHQVFNESDESAKILYFCIMK